MNAPAAVLALVLLTTAVGSGALLWFAPTWGAVRHGYEMLTGATVALLAWGAWASLSSPAASLSGTELASDADLARLTIALFAGLTAAAVIALAVRLPPIIARLLGSAGVLAGLVAFLPLAIIRSERGGAGGVAQGIAELALGAILMGGIWVGMILGHWYLVERRLSNRYMLWMAWMNVGAVAAGAASVLLSWRNPVPCSELTGAEFERCILTFSPILRYGSMTIVMGLGVLALIALIAGFNVKLAREGGRSIQASTGMFYLAVILAPAVEFAAKVRFF